MKNAIFIFLASLMLYAGSVKEPTQIVEGEIYDYEQTETQKQNDRKNGYYLFTLVEDGTVFIVNQNADETHSYRIYDENFKFVKSDEVKDSTTESLYEGKYLYHNLKGSFSIYSNNLKPLAKKEDKKTAKTESKKTEDKKKDSGENNQTQKQNELLK